MNILVGVVTAAWCALVVVLIWIARTKPGKGGARR